MSTTKNWFEVDRQGLKQLQDGKPKTFLLRELIQNAFDEKITTCKVNIKLLNRITTIIVEDDSPEGFKDLKDSYTLFADTYKRRDSEKRGRFNLGEKQAFSICDSAMIITTTGGVLFDKNGRKFLRRKRPVGSQITLTLKMAPMENRDLYDYCQEILVPKGIKFEVDYDIQLPGDYKKIIPYIEPHEIFKTRLQTEIEREGAFRATTRETNVHIHGAKNKQAFLYEMGLPVCEIDCDYSIDVQQKVPLSADRDSVRPSFLKALYGEVLNQTHEEIEEERSSNLWVRTGFASDRATDEAIKNITTKRFGEKAAIANNFDPKANDEAISKNYNVIQGSEMDKEEWNQIKKVGALETTTKLFGTDPTADWEFVDSTPIQSKIGKWIEKMAKDILNLELKVKFMSCTAPGVTMVADYGGDTKSGTIRFNVPRLPATHWELDKDGTINKNLLGLTIHELGHSRGWHYEHSYHDCLTELGSKLTKKALSNPKYFRI